MLMLLLAASFCFLLKLLLLLRCQHDAVKHLHFYITVLETRAVPTKARSPRVTNSLLSTAFIPPTHALWASPGEVDKDPLPFCPQWREMCKHM